VGALELALLAQLAVTNERQDVARRQIVVLPVDAVLEELVGARVGRQDGSRLAVLCLHERPLTLGRPRGLTRLAGDDEVVAPAEKGQAANEPGVLDFAEHGPRLGSTLDGVVEDVHFRAGSRRRRP
jgi:hypothetical protein